MLCQFQFHAYQRPFKCPLQTSHGIWKVREGILLQLIDQTGQVGKGEIAPLPWFGSETLAQAQNFCHQLPNSFEADTIFAIPPALTACQFGFEMAWEEVAKKGKGQRARGEEQVLGYKEQHLNAALPTPYSVLRTPHSFKVHCCLREKARYQAGKSCGKQAIERLSGRLGWKP